MKESIVIHHKKNKIRVLLTDKEKALAADASLMLAKNTIIEEVYSLFGSLAEAYLPFTVHLPAELTLLHPKISRGENYRGLPWVMLDYPRWFTKDHVFAIRTMFWWGHYFSLHLLLQGDKMPYFNPIDTPAGWYFATGTHPWEHHFNATSSIAANKVGITDLENQKRHNQFYKLSSYLPLTEWDKAENFLKEKFEEATRMVDRGTFR